MLSSVFHKISNMLAEAGIYNAELRIDEVKK